MPALVHRLRFKVAASATLATVAALLAILTLFELFHTLARRHALADPAVVEHVADQARLSAAQLSALGRLDAEIAKAFLDAQDASAHLALPGPGVPVAQRFAVLDLHREPLAGSVAGAPSIADPVLDRMLEAAPDRDVAGQRQSDGSVVAVAAVYGAARELIGFVILEVDAYGRSLGALLRHFATALPTTALLLLPAGAVVGTLFGLVTTRGLVRRLRRLGEVAAAWSRGELGARVEDPSGDELGELTRDLETMARELELWADRRRELAAMDERNRLARDLHDTVKQHAFSLSMFLSSAQAALPDSATAAADQLGEARRLVSEIGRDLDGLILALRPASLREDDLPAALGSLVDEWSQRTGLAAELRVRGEPDLPLAVEESLFRVAQEALANVARHARAGRISVRFDGANADETAAVRLVVKDDGDGFEAASASPSGFGLESMRQRMDAVDGRLEVRSEPRRGTVIEATWSAGR